jgi:hypothetical protein
MGIVITEKNVLVLEKLARYYVLTRKMIQEMCFPHVRSSRSVCERLRKLKKEGFISQADMQIVLSGQSASPVYYPNKKTAQTLAAFYGNDSFLNIYTKPPASRLLFHWVEIAKTHYLVDQAVEASEAIELVQWYNEWEVINKDTPNKNLHFTIHSVLRQEPTIVCQPDAAFLLECGGHRKVFYVEVDRGTDSIRRIARKKPAGYAMMDAQNRHLKHFPTSTLESFSVLFITTTEYRRDELLKRLPEKETPHLWRTAWRGELDQTNLFSELVWREPGLEMVSLVSMN